MFIEDLSTNGYFATGDNLRAVGWLESGQPYSKGNVDDAFLARLKQLLANAYQPVLFMGIHECSLCSEGVVLPSGKVGFYGDYRNLLIPTDRFLYIAPALIGHYIEYHQYLPPQEFIDAVHASPDQQSSEYMKLLRRFSHLWEPPAQT